MKMMLAMQTVNRRGEKNDDDDEEIIECIKADFPVLLRQN